jgi:hypothetical protein
MKQKASKLDAYAERLQDWFIAGQTLAQAQEQLRLDGCDVSLSRLSDWWQARQSARQEELLLSQIASGARQCHEVRAALSKSPSPEVETLIALHRTLVLKLSTQANLDPAMFKVVGSLMDRVLEWEKERGKKEDRSLARAKFEFDAAKACLKKLPELKVISTDRSLTDDQRVEQIRMKLFGELPGEVAA